MLYHAHLACSQSQATIADAFISSATHVLAVASKDHEAILKAWNPKRHVPLPLALPAPAPVLALLDLPPEVRPAVASDLVHGAVDVNAHLPNHRSHRFRMLVRKNYSKSSITIYDANSSASVAPSSGDDHCDLPMTLATAMASSSGSVE